MSTAALYIKVEFGGGLELLFDNKRSHRITIPAFSSATSSTDDQNEEPGKDADVTFLIHWLKDNLLRERAELFVENGTVYVRLVFRVLGNPTAA